MRFEIKFAYPPQFADRVEGWLHSRIEAFREVYEPRTVHNVYFDTQDLEAFGENLSGTSRRCKVRYRWYGDDPLPRRGNLEFKHKRSTLGWKEVFPVEHVLWQEGDSWRQFHRRLRAELPPASRLMFDEHPQATLLNSYRRRYFESRNGILRITLDSDQRMFDQMCSRGPNVLRRTTLPAVHVLELKCEETERQAAVRALADCPVRGSRFSKYTIGIEMR